MCDENDDDEAQKYVDDRKTRMSPRVSEYMDNYNFGYRTNECVCDFLYDCCFYNIYIYKLFTTYI